MYLFLSNTGRKANVNLAIMCKCFFTYQRIKAFVFLLGIGSKQSIFISINDLQYSSICF